MDKEVALHNIAYIASKLFIESNIPEYINSKDGYKLLVSDLTTKYEEAYKQAFKELKD